MLEELAERQSGYRTGQRAPFVQQLDMPLVGRDGLPVLGWNGVQAELSISLTFFLWNLDAIAVEKSMRLRLRHIDTMISLDCSQAAC